MRSLALCLLASCILMGCVTNGATPSPGIQRSNQVFARLAQYAEDRRQEIEMVERAANLVRAQGVDATVRRVETTVYDRATKDNLRITQLLSFSFRTLAAQHGNDVEVDAAITAGRLAAKLGGQILLVNPSPLIVDAVTRGYQSVLPGRPASFSSDTAQVRYFSVRGFSDIMVTRTVERAIN